MRKILIIGAGKSTPFLIAYLLGKAKQESLYLTLADSSLDRAEKLLPKSSNSSPIGLDVRDAAARGELIANTQLVISMLPAHLHIEVAKDCLKYKKHLVTASYASEAMNALNAEVIEKGLVFLNEMGLDPGLDHMSAMSEIDRIREDGGTILLFESFCGGLVAPESDTNLWNYKFTWNPRNVVLAGQGGAAEFIQEGSYKYIPYQRLFRRTEFLDVENYGRFEAYANRNSLKYRELYQLEDVLTLYRGTIRRVGFSRAWNVFVQLGMTDDSYILQHSEGMSYRDFVNLFLPYSPTDSVELKLRHQLKIDQDDLLWDKLMELDLFSQVKKINLDRATPAQCLEKILKDKWTLSDTDRDMVVMYHKIGYQMAGEKFQKDLTMVCEGENNELTAMAKTVGLPLAIGALRILNRQYIKPGVQIPTSKDLYLPVLEELKQNGIHFKSYTVPYLGYNSIHL